MVGLAVEPRIATGRSAPIWRWTTRAVGSATTLRVVKNRIRMRQSRVEQRPQLPPVVRSRADHGCSTSVKIRRLCRDVSPLRRRVDVASDRGRRPPDRPASEEQQEDVQLRSSGRSRHGHQDDSPDDGTADAVGGVAIQSLPHRRSVPPHAARASNGPSDRAHQTHLSAAWWARNCRCALVC